MNLSFFKSIIIVTIVAICTFITRFLPFALFGGNKKIPTPIKYLGKILPPAIIATLVIYSLKNINFLIFPFGISKIISVAVVACLHIWKKNILLSIGAGTLSYMVLVQYVFVG